MSEATFVPGMRESDYHAHPALGSTDLKNLLRSPAHFVTAKLDESPETPALRLGTLVHECILDPGAWESRVVTPDFNRRTKAGREAAADFEHTVAAQGLQQVSAEEKALCEQMRASAMENTLVKAVLDHAEEREVSCFWSEGETACKARLDAHKPGLVLDLKTTVDASHGAFRNAVARYRYHVQAAHYSVGVHAVTGVWPDYAILAIEKSPPYACALYMLDEEALSVGTELRSRALRTHYECKKRGAWPAYPQATQVLTLPRWAAEEM